MKRTAPKIDFRDWEHFLVLLAEKVKSTETFILHGSIAMGFYGPRRPSQDVDFIAKRSFLSVFTEVESEKTDLSKTLERIGFTQYRSFMLDDGAGFVRSYQKGFYKIDVHETDSKHFKRLKERSTVIETPGGKRRIYIISVEDLIRMKRIRGAPQDLADIAALEHLQRRKDNGT